VNFSQKNIKTETQTVAATAAVAVMRVNVYYHFRAKNAPCDFRKYRPKDWSVWPSN